MSYYPDTNTLTFLTEQPDRSGDLRYRIGFTTPILGSKMGAEQRMARRDEGVYSISYTREYEKQTWALRRVQVMQQLKAAVVVPIWVRPKQLVSIVSNTVTLDVTSLIYTPFKIGSFAYFEEDGKASCFRKITAKGETSIDVEAGDAAFPVITPPTYTAAALVYPCIVGIYEDSKSDFFSRQIAETGEQVTIVEI